LKKSLMVWMIILIYPISICFGVSLASCCIHESCNVDNEAAGHVHAHPRIHFAAHLFSKSLEVDCQFSPSNHMCSCAASHPEGSTQDTCVVDSQPTHSRLLPNNQFPCIWTASDPSFGSCPTGSSSSNAQYQTSLSQEPTFSVVLLI
jgi:hypothetical protein